MIFDFDNGQFARNWNSPNDDPRHAAWEYMVGSRPAGRSRSPRRGDLPDVEGPLPPPRPPLARRMRVWIGRWFGGKAGRPAEDSPADTSSSAGERDLVAQDGGTAYMKPVRSAAPTVANDDAIERRDAAA